MISLNKPITQEHIDIYQMLSISAKTDMLDMRPGWTYRGPILNGKVYVDFQTWQNSKYAGISGDFSRYRANNYGYRGRKDSALDRELDSIDIADIFSCNNWNYCLEFKRNRQDNIMLDSIKTGNRLDTPAHAMFISDNSEWLLETAKKNLEKAEYEVLKVDSTIKGSIKTVSMEVEDNVFIGQGSTIRLASLMLYGKTHQAKHDMLRPSFSMFREAKDVKITDLIFGEETLEISDEIYMPAVMNSNDTHRYCEFISNADKDHIQFKLKGKFIYYGKYRLVEGDYHIVQCVHSYADTYLR